MLMYVWLVSVCPLVEHTRDLGITVTNDLSPSHHIAVIVIRAHKRAGGILRAIIRQTTPINICDSVCPLSTDYSSRCDSMDGQVEHGYRAVSPVNLAQNRG